MIQRPHLTGPRSRAATATTSVLATAAAGALLWAMLTVDSLQLASPDLAEPASWGRWAASLEPIDLVASSTRLLTIGLLSYLVLVLGLQTFAVLRPQGIVRRVSDRITPRILMGAAAGALVSTSALSAPGALAASGPSPGAPPTSSGPVEMKVVDAAPLDDGVGQATSLPWAAATDGPATPRPAAPPPAPQALPASPAKDAPPATGAVHVVVRGDHLWGIAETTLTDRSGTAPTDDQVAAYWRVLINVNRDRLVDRSNPDLILPGQELLLP